MTDKSKNKKIELEEYLLSLNNKILQLSENNSLDRIDLYVENRSKVIQLIEKKGITLKNTEKLENQFSQIIKALERNKLETERDILKNRKIQKNNRLYLKG